MATERSEYPSGLVCISVLFMWITEYPLLCGGKGIKEGTDMWKVMQIVKNGIAFYVVENTETGERKRGEFDCERSAQSFADYLNKKEE